MWNFIKNLAKKPSSSSSSRGKSGNESPGSSSDAQNNIPNITEKKLKSEIPPLPGDVGKERKRLEVINELFNTESIHCQKLKILQDLFYKPMSQDPNISQDLTDILFPNLGDIIILHDSMNSAMKKRQQRSMVPNVGDILLDCFESGGKAFGNGCVKFYQNYLYASDVLKAKQRKDSKLAKFIMEAENSCLMQGLHLQDLMLAEIQRLMKYLWFINKLLKYTQPSEERSRLHMAICYIEMIVGNFHRSVRDCETTYMLQQRIDKEQFNRPDLKELDLTKHRLILDGTLTWNVNQRKSIDCHVVLLEDLLVLFEKQDEKLVLKQQSSQLVTDREESRYQFSPLISLENVLHTNTKATDKLAFFIVSKNQIYEFSAASNEEQTKWVRHIKKTVETFRRNKAEKDKPAAERSIDVRQEKDLGEEKFTVENPPTQKDFEIPAEHLLQHMKTEMTTVRHARGIVVGCGGAGKTTLLYSLMGKSLDEINEIKSTRGLQVYEHIFSVKDGSLIATCTESLFRKPLIRIPISSLTMQTEEIEYPSPSIMPTTDSKEEDEEQKAEGKLSVPFTSGDKSNTQMAALFDNDEVHKTIDKEFNNKAVETLTPEVIKNILDAQENEISVSMIDFAGQFAYYACHQIYMRSKAFYILVMDMTKDLNEVVSGKEEDQQGSVFSKWTYKGYLEFWLNSIKSFGGHEAPVLIVATHTEGKTGEQKEIFFERLWSSLPEEDAAWLSEHSSEDGFAFGLLEMNRDKKLQKLESLKKLIVKTVSHKLETKINVRSSWALLEHLLQDTGKRIISCDEIEDLMNKNLPEEYRLESIKEIPTFLTFFHDHGLLLYFKDEATQTHAILGIQWFSDAFAKLIADKSHINEDCKRRHIKEWNHFNQTGELNSKLVDALWAEKEKGTMSNTQSYKEYKHELMAYMEKLRMLVSISDSEKGQSWYVPCMNKRPFEKNIFRTNSARSSVLCFRFSSFAMFVFYRLIAHCIGNLEWDVSESKCGKCLFQTASVFEYKNHTVVVGICNYDIQMQVVVESLEIETKVSCEVGHLIHKALDDLTKTFENTNLNYKRGYKCQKEICDQSDTSFTPEEELCQSKIEKIQCSCCPVGEKHILSVHETRRFWEQEKVQIASGQDMGRGRFAKLVMAIYDVLNQAYRDILEMEIPPSDIENKVNASPNKKKMNLNKDQEELLKKAIYSGYMNFDISLIYTLIRNICSKTSKPTKGKWGGMPASGEVTVGDDVERIRSIRNKLCAHVSSAFISQTDFDDTWTTISDICQRLEVSTGKKYLDKLNEIKKLSIKETVKDDIIKKFQKMQKTWESFNLQMQEFETMLKP